MRISDWSSDVCSSDLLIAVGQHEVRAIAELLDEAEDVIPAAAVQPGRMIAQFVQDLVHLESGEDRLDQHRRLDGAALDAELVLGMVEDIVPEEIGRAHV